MSDSRFPPREERLGEIVPLICAVPEAGPPVIFLIGPWVLFALMLTGPFALLVIFVLAAVILVVIAAAIVVPPYLLIHQLRNRWTSRVERRARVHRLREGDPIHIRLRPSQGQR